MDRKRAMAFLAIVIFYCSAVNAQSTLNVIAYYSGGPEKADALPAGKLTHIIFSFCHLNGNQLSLDSQRDTLTLQRLVNLKKKNPSLKVLVSLGGWGGCPTCSDVFSTATARQEFSESVLRLNQYFNTDGIDLDWEYPAIEGYPGHTFAAHDRPNFTALVQVLRKTLGPRYEISFAAGGFRKFLEESVDWVPVMNELDRVNIMSYDLVNGYATVTGHHTPLFSGQSGEESADYAVQFLLRLGIPANKLVIGAAFYGRMWENVPPENNGLYQPGSFVASIPYHRFDREFSPQQGFAFHWDEKCQAPFLYNREKKRFITYDDPRSIRAKTEYAVKNRLNGIMFWELSLDTNSSGLLDAIHEIKKRSASR